MADKERTESLQGHTVDLDKLRTELLAAKASEERYQRENDAKFRAIAQRVGSYEEFRWATASIPWSTLQDASTM